jgi:hypothetical protein
MVSPAAASSAHWAYTAAADTRPAADGRKRLTGWWRSNAASHHSLMV